MMSKITVMRFVLMGYMGLSLLGCGRSEELSPRVQELTEKEEQGGASAQYNLGVMYDNGEGVPKDNDKAITWYRKAAEQGHVSGQYKLGNKYARGKGVPQNYAEAYVWFNLSAASGHEEATESRNRYASELSRDVLAESQRRSAQLFEEIQKRKAGLLKKTPLSPET